MMHGLVRPFRAPRTAAALGLLAAALTTACASASTRASRALIDREVSHKDSVVVHVVNRSGHRIAVARVRQGAPATLGAVSAGGEARFALRAADVQGARMTLAATPVGDRTGVRSAPFDVRSGQVVVFMITPELVGSQVLVDWPSR
jgi:hypothetical protein